MQYGAISSLGLELYPVESHISYLPLSWGDVANFDPEILLVCGRVPGRDKQKRCPGCSVKNRPCARDVEDIYQIPDIAGMKAVQEKRVFTIPCSFFCRPGPRILEGMEWLVGIL
jgi:iron complex transport system substrate-binding protein